jgi:hypothetical protein
MQVVSALRGNWSRHRADQVFGIRRPFKPGLAEGHVAGPCVRLVRVPGFDEQAFGIGQRGKDIVAVWQPAVEPFHELLTFGIRNLPHGGDDTGHTCMRKGSGERRVFQATTADARLKAPPGRFAAVAVPSSPPRSAVHHLRVQGTTERDWLD